MNRKLAMGLAVFIVGVCGVSAQEPPVKPLAVFDAAPELEIRAVKGKPVTLSEGLGKNVYIVEFWATWCAPCKFSVPHLTALQAKYRKEGLVVIGITDEDLKTVQKYMAERGAEMEYTVAIDQNRATWNRYMKASALSGIPMAFVIDKGGRIIWNGHPMDPIIEDLVDALLEEEVEVPKAEPEVPADEKGESQEGGKP